MLDEARKGGKERLRAAAKKGDKFVVSLNRDKHALWGLELNEETMELTNCTEGSRAARNATVCGSSRLNRSNR